MKNLTKLTFAIFAFTLLFTACSSSDDDSPQPNRIAKEITAEELVGYQILEEFDIKAEYTQQYGDKPRLYVYAIKQGPTADVFHLVMNSGTIQVIRNVNFDSATGLTKVETDNGYIELTRDNSNNIIANKGFQFKNENDSKEINSKYTQVVKTNTETFNNKVYKAVEGINGYYRFSEARKWIYIDPTPPAEFELTWDYTNVTNTIWYGKDNGTAKYNNRFVIIPKGNGWKGQYKDKDLLLAHTWDNAGKVISNIAVCLQFTDPADVDVYIVGYMNNNLPTLWKNGVASTVSGAQSLNSVFVSKNNLYIAGRSESKPVYWKNNTKIILPGSSSAFTTAIFVNGNDVYVSGREDNKAVLWKNGVKTILTNTSYGANASGVYVYGTDVYVAGHHGVSAVLWKNGTQTTLTTGSIEPKATCVFVNGTDVYVGGKIGENGAIWKNGVATSFSAVINNVFVTGNDVYAVGYTGKIARFWKNGTETSLTNGNYVAEATDIFVAGNDVYVVGHDNHTPKLWKNGTETILGNSGEAHSVFVAPKY